MLAQVYVDTLHVISDLHLGGEEGFQIFRCGKEFERLTETIISEAEAGSVGLVVNGDFVDFLAESSAEFFAIYSAEAKLKRILADPAFAPVTTGLRRLLSTPNVVVAINLGNHDLELALPWVRRCLTTLLTEDDPVRRGRLVLAFDGVGIRCMVGIATILCLHGNEVDAWNVTNHEVIRKIARDVTRGLPVETWIPNAGTQLVVSVMNEVKRCYPFVDVLKPETGAVLPVLFALDPALAKKVSGLVGTLPRRTADDTRLRMGWLGETPAATVQAPDQTVGPPLDLSGSGRIDRAAMARALMDQAETRHLAGDDALSLVTAGQRGDNLGFGSATFAYLVGKPKVEVLRRALDGLDTDQSFNPFAEDDTYREIDKLVGGSVDFIVTGHTHLRRALPRRNGSGRYYNSGTWAALMQIDRDVRQDPDGFRNLFESLGRDNIVDLETKGLLRREPTVVSFWKDGGKVKSELREVITDSQVFSPVSNTQFTWG
jgi:UDP-2,3-diacylglucosamine pyrophosphatase LpxH